MKQIDTDVQDAEGSIPSFSNPTFFSFSFFLFILLFTFGFSFCLFIFIDFIFKKINLAWKVFDRVQIGVILQSYEMKWNAVVSRFSTNFINCLNVLYRLNLIFDIFGSINNIHGIFRLKIAKISIDSHKNKYRILNEDLALKTTFDLYTNFLNYSHLFFILFINSFFLSICCLIFSDFPP